MANGGFSNGAITTSDATTSRTNLNVPSTTGSGASGTWPISITGSSGSVPNPLTVSTGLQLNSGTTYDGSAAETITIDSTVATLSGTQTLTNKTEMNPILLSGSSTYTTGTASQANTTVTGSGTTFTSDMVGGLIVFSGGQTAWIQGFISTTSLQCLPSQSVSNTSFTLYYNGVQMDAHGNIGLQTGNSKTYITSPTFTDVTDKTKTATISLSSQTTGTNSTIVTDTLTQTLTNKTVRSPIITIGSTTYTTGTASQSGTTIIGTGTTWTSSMIGGIIVWASGEHAFIRGFLDTTDLQGITSQTVADGPYTIYHSGIQADSRGNIGLEAGSTSILLGKPQINDIADKTKVIAFSLTGQTTNTQLTLATPISASRTITFPDATTTLVGQGTALGTPLSGTLTNCSGTASALTAGTVTTNANLTGVITSVGNATTIASQTGTGTKFVVDTSPTLVTPLLGTPTSGNLTNCTSLPATSVNAATSNSYTPALSGGPTFTMSTQTGGYRVIAGITYYWAHIDWSGKNGATTGQLSITLPSAPTAADRIACYIGYTSGMPSGAFIMGLAEQSTADVQFYKIVSGTTSGLIANDVSTGGAFYISGWYY